MAIRHKLILGFFIVSLLVIIVAFFGIYATDSIISAYSTEEEETLPIIRSLTDMKIAGITIISFTHEIVHFPLENGTSAPIGEKEYQDVLSGMGSYDKAFEQYEGLVNRFFPDERIKLENLRIAGQRLKKISFELIDLKKQEASEIIFKQKHEEFEEAQTDFLQAVDDALAAENNEFAKRTENVGISIENTKKIILLASLLTIFISLPVGLYISRYISRPIDQLKNAAVEMGKGNLSARVNINSKDEFGILSGAFNQMASDLEQHTDHLDALVKERTIALSESEGKFKSIFDNALDGILVTDIETQKFLMGNRVMCEMLGFDENELKNLSVKDIYPEKDMPYVMEQFEKQRTKEIGLANELPLKRKDGSIFYADVNASPFVIGGKAYLLGIFRDISERKQAQEKIAASAIRWNSTFDAINDGIFILDNEWKITQCNKALSTLLGKPVSSIIGHTCWELVHRTSAPIEECPYLQVKKTHNREKTILSLGDRWFNVILDPLLDNSGNLTGAVHILSDITEQKQNEDKLKAQNEFIKLVIDSLTHPFYVINVKDHTVAIANAAGPTIGDGATCYAVSHKKTKPCESKEHPCPLEEVKRTKKPAIVEHIHFDGDDNPMNVEVHCYPIFDAKGSVVKVIEYSLDITERKRAEEKILKLNRVYVVISQINRAIVRSGEQHILLNEACRIAVEYGTFQMAWIGFVDEKTNFVKPVSYSGVDVGYFLKIKTISVEDVPEGRGQTGTAIREGQYYVCNDIEKDPRMDLWREEALKRGYHSSIALPIKMFGKVIGAFTLYASVPQFFDKEEINLLEEITNDISYSIDSIETIKKKKEAESALLESEERYRTLYESSSDAIMLLDDNGFFDCNNATLLIFGFSKKEDFTKVHPSQVSPPIQPDGVDSMTAANNRIAEAFRTGTNRFEWVHRKTNGEDFPAEVLLSAFNFKGKHVLQATVRDISERKRTVEELLLARDEALRASRVKSEFLAMISHELRTPLNAIMGFSNLLKMKVPGELNEKQEEYINHIFISGTRLLGIINDILDIVNIESGEQLPLSIGSFSVLEAIENTLVFVIDKAEYKNILLKKEIDPELGVISADELRFKQILLHLLENAIKFSKPEGGAVTIAAIKTDGFAQFSISDTGIGIRDEDMGKIFGLFHQLDSGLNRRYGGTGIGLPIVKQLVEQHGGRIWVESKYGEGTTSTFTLPIHQ